jgi:hypothetical protein
MILRFQFWTIAKSMTYLVSKDPIQLPGGRGVTDRQDEPFALAAPVLLRVRQEVAGEWMVCRGFVVTAPSYAHSNE